MTLSGPWKGLAIIGQGSDNTGGWPQAIRIPLLEVADVFRESNGQLKTNETAVKGSPWL